MKKIYQVTKYVAADSIEEALKRERRVRPDEIWMTEHSKN